MRCGAKTHEMADSNSDRLVGENRCWPCTVSNAAVAALIGGIPLFGGISSGEPALIAVTSLWAVAVLGYTLFRLINRGYLPGAETIAKRTGLHDRIGPGRNRTERDHDRRE